MPKKKEKEKRKKEKDDKEEEREEPKTRPSLHPTVKSWILAVFLFGAAIFSMLAIFGGGGRAGYYFGQGLKLSFGWGSFVFSIALILIGYYIFTRERRLSMRFQYVGVFLLMISFLGLLHLFMLDEGGEAMKRGGGGGYVGYGVSYAINQAAGFWGSLIILAVLFIVAILIIFETWIIKLRDRRIEKKGSWLGLGEWWRRMMMKLAGGRGGDEEGCEETEKLEVANLHEFSTNNTNTSIADKVNSSNNSSNIQCDSGATTIKINNLTDGIAARRRRRERIDLPINLLVKPYGRAMGGDIERNKEVIQKTLKNFGIPVEMGEIKVGPTVTQYTLRPADGVKLSKIITLQNDLALALAAHPIRIEAPIPGRSLVGIEVPNEVTATVVLREILETEEFKKRANNLTIALGKDVSGHPWTADLGRLPHLLVAGATGSGKSVCLNSIIVSLLYQNSSDDLKFILVDPKRVELTNYNGIPHLLAPVITDVPKVIRALRWTVGEMERRFHVLSEAGRRDIKSYNSNRTEGERMPYIVFAIDELADLMTAAGAEVEGLIIRLAQMSRAVGIHLILATQRPSVDIITGLIKANIPSRIAFSVASLTDSRTILDMSGAEKLLGRGDMLYISAEISKPKRLQGAFLSDREIENVIRYLRERSEPDYNNEIAEAATESPGGFGNVSGVDIGDDDELLEEAKKVIIQAGKASASLLQRRLRIGYARAARILDLLEERGIIGPADGAKPRDVLAGRREEENVEYVEEVERKLDKVEDIEDVGNVEGGEDEK